MNPTIRFFLCAAFFLPYLLVSSAFANTGKATGTEKKPETPPAKAQTPTLPPSPAAVPGDLAPLNDKDRESEFKAFGEDYKTFRKAALDYLNEVRALVQKQYNERRKLIVGGYERKLKDLETREEIVRKNAIQYFLAFVRQYPTHARYTPDAMYRLAELYYEEEFNSYLGRAKKYEEELQKYENKEIAYEPTPAKKVFTETTRWLSNLLQQFPSYRFADGAYYLLGYCKGEEGNDQEALAYFQIIPQKFPQSKLLAEAWIRLGEFYFRTDQREKAKEAYEKVLTFKDHPMYDKALYKLAWTHYLNDEFQTAVERFIQLLEFYQGKKEEDGGGDLRREAIAYIAISLADEKWGSPEKAEELIRKIGLEKPYARDILVELAKNYRTQNSWDMEIAVNRKLLQLYPFHPMNPLVQERIIQGYMQKRETATAMLERDKLLSDFGPNSEWAKRNEKDIRAQREVQNILSKNIYGTAIYKHESCNVRRTKAEIEKDEAQRAILLEEAKKECLLAAENYREFLRRFPHHKEVYNLTWYLADSLYFAQRYEEASENFQKVRDWPSEKKYFNEASFSLIDSLVKIANAECDKGTIKRACETEAARKQEAEEAKEKDKPKGKGKKKDSLESMRRRKIDPLPIHPLQQRLVAARDFFLEKVKDPKDERLPEQMYMAARIFYSYDHLQEARRRLMDLIKKYYQDPKHAKLLQAAGDTIVASYRTEGRLDEMVSAIDDLKQYRLNFAYEKELKVGVIFIKAKRLQEAGKWEEAANAFVQAVDKQPQHKDAPAGLWNAALMYEKAKLFGSALKLYERIVQEYPGWQLEDGKAGADQALFFVAFNAEKYFNFDKAIERYMSLVNDRNYRSSQKRPDALYNAALLLENMQRYGEAAQAYQRYAKEFSDRKDAPEMLYNAAKVYKKMNRTEDMISVFQQFIRRYERDKEQARRVMLAYGEIMESHEKAGKPWNFMKRQYEDIIRVFARLKDRMQGVDIALTRDFPAKAAYMLAMKEYDAFSALRIDSSDPERQKKQIAEKIKRYSEVTKLLSGIIVYSSAPWLLCAMYRIAEGKQKTAQAASGAPLPRVRGFKWTDEAKDLYKEKIDKELILPLENQAQDLYKQVVNKSKELFYTNQCTYDAHVAINRADPSFPLPKKSEPKSRFEDLSPMPLIRSLKEPKPAPPETKNDPKEKPKS